MKQCDAGLHFYNVDVYDECPTCQQDECKTDAIDVEARIKDPKMNEKTQLINLGGTTPVNNNALKTRVIGSSALNSKGKASSLSLPVTGWLVIIAGPGKGADFKLIQGNNRIGRDAKMDVCLDFGSKSDESVSRDTHAIVVYDNNSNEFFIERGDSRNMPMVNGKTVRRDQDLKGNDIIELGGTKLMFFPLCTEQFRW